MESVELQKLIADGPYRAAAYDFVMRALDYTIQRYDEVRHVTGAELSEGLRDFAMLEFGPMAKYVLNEWGVKGTRDFGEIVFRLVDHGVLRKTEEDSIEDFEKVFVFADVFEGQYYQHRSKLGDQASV